MVQQLLLHEAVRIHQPTVGNGEIVSALRQLPDVELLLEGLVSFVVAAAQQ